jgi:hypothetical protein
MDLLQKERIAQKTAAVSARLTTLKAQAAEVEEKETENPESAKEAPTTK